VHTNVAKRILTVVEDNINADKTWNSALVCVQKLGDVCGPHLTVDYHLPTTKTAVLSVLDQLLGRSPKTRGRFIPARTPPPSTPDRWYHRDNNKRWTT